jgi:hypothetical protein
MLHMAPCIAKCLAKAKGPGSASLMGKTRLGGTGTEARLRVAMIHSLLTEHLIRVSEMCLVGAPAKHFGALFRQFPAADLAGVMFILLSS